MSNYNSLKATIDANIKTNGNQEITGAVLNYVLNEVVTILGDGYQFKGIATTSTNPGTPDARVFYLAGAGAYTHFGQPTIQPGNLGVFWYDSAWHTAAIDVAPVIDIVNNLTDGGADKALSAEMGKDLNDRLNAQTISIEGTHLIIGRITSDSYVTDGLVFHLDGINKGSIPGAWTDLVGGISFANNNCNFLDNCVEFPSGVWGFLTSTAEFSQGYATGTIEIVYEGDISGGNRFLFYPKADNNLMVSYAKALNVFVMGSKIATTTYTPVTTTGVSRLSMTTSHGIQNLESLVRAGTGYFADMDSNLYVGRRPTSTASMAFVGKIYSIRIYNRQLSEIEMRKNQVYDQTRFSL